MTFTFSNKNTQAPSPKKTTGFFNAVNVYPKLSINQPNDKYEQQADAMAEKVMAKPESNGKTAFDNEDNSIYTGGKPGINSSTAKNALNPAIKFSSNSKTAIIQRTISSPTFYEGRYAEEEENESQAPPIQRMEALNQSTPTNHNPNLKYPWSSLNHAGYDYYLHTDRGAQVIGWVGFEDIYWCHGHSLDTFRNWSYSIYSGQNMGKVINDEFNQVNDANVQQGDIAVWEPSYGHSAKFSSVSRTGAGALDENRTVMSTKNGPQPLANKSLTEVKNDYRQELPGSVVRHYRHV